jgi:hypothetical protein
MDDCMITRKEIMDQTFNKSIECRKCDLASLKSIREFAEKINNGLHDIYL